MAEITIYTTPFCPYCSGAKALLKSKGQTWTEIDVSEDEKIREAMIERSGGRRTTPQIFIDGKHIGGFDDLRALNEQGGLDTLLK